MKGVELVQRAMKDAPPTLKVFFQFSVQTIRAWRHDLSSLVVVINAFWPIFGAILKLLSD